MNRSVDLRFGDCLAVLRELSDESVHAVICDPPYGLADVRPERVVTALTAWANGDRDHVPDGKGFMGREWDAFVPPPAVWDECLRVLKPGGHLLAFAGSRTADLMGLSVRMAGFEIRDTIMWVYGSGFPKGQNVGKAAKVAELEGWNTALKPAQEPIIVARKPLAGTVAANVLAWGCGAININATRVGPNGGSRESLGREAAPRGCRVHAVRDVRQGDAPLAFAGAASEVADDLQSEVQGRPAARATEPAVGRRRLDGESVGLPEAGSPPPVGQGPVADPGTTSARGVRAPHGDGEEGRSAAPADGDGPSHQRGQGGQPSGEPALDGLGGALPGASADRARADDVALAEHGPGDCTCGTDAASGVAPAGRWPANVVLVHVDTCEDGGACGDCPVAELDRQSGITKTGDKPFNRNTALGVMNDDAWTAQHQTAQRHPGEGGASRFFPTFRYQAKAPAAERPKIDGKGWPTVKPQGLMRWLVRLVTPPGGLVLDPFAGTGSTLQAARDEGFDAIGIERDAFAYQLACQRLGLTELVLVEPEPVDPILTSISAAATYDDLVALWREHQDGWSDVHSAAAKDRRAAIDVVA